jgi:cell division protein FtsX
LINVNLLPKSLKRIREPGYWRVLAVAVPLVVAGVLFGIQYLTNQTIANLQRDVQLREDQLALLQPFLDEQRQLQTRQAALRELIAIAEEVRRGQVLWTTEIAALLETCPARGDGGRRRSTSAA